MHLGPGPPGRSNPRPEHDLLLSPQSGMRPAPVLESTIEWASEETGIRNDWKIINFWVKSKIWKKSLFLRFSGLVSYLMEMGASLCIEWDSRRRNRWDLEKLKKFGESKKLPVIQPSGHSWMPLGSIPGHPDAYRSFLIFVISVIWYGFLWF